MPVRVFVLVPGDRISKTEEILIKSGFDRLEKKKNDKKIATVSLNSKRKERSDREIQSEANK